MFAIRSLVLGALLSVWQPVKCQNQGFLINPAFAPISTFSRSSRNSGVISSQGINQPNSYDPMKYENDEETGTNPNANSNSKINVNVHRAVGGPFSVQHSKSTSIIRPQKAKTRNIRKKNSTSDIKGLIRAINPDLSADLDLILPYDNDLTRGLLGRRNAIINSNEDNNDNELVCYNCIKNILLNMEIIKKIIQDIETQIIDCVGTLQTSV